MKSVLPAYVGESGGLALLLLRGSTALALFDRFQGKVGCDLWMTASICLLGTAIAFGFFTRFFALIALAVFAVSLFLLDWNDDTLPFFTSQILETVALALIGPGAFSIDAISFGRSTISLTE